MENTNRDEFLHVVTAWICPRCNAAKTSEGPPPSNGCPGDPTRGISTQTSTIHIWENQLTVTPGTLAGNWSITSVSGSIPQAT